MKITTNINKNIFRGYDIRGKYPTDKRGCLLYNRKKFGSLYKKI